MSKLPKLLREHELWLMERILQYAKRYGYAKYTSTLLEPWRISISELTDSLCQALETHTEYHLDADGILDSPLTAFGVKEAQTYRDRGITLGSFLALMKYYRDSYMDLIEAFIEELPTDENAKYFVLHAFDVMEAAFIDEWGKLSGDEILRGMQLENRVLTNDKNFYVTVFESIPVPLLILNDKLELLNMNFRAIQLISDTILNDNKSSAGVPRINKEGDRMSRLKHVDFSEFFRYNFQAFIDNRTLYHENAISKVETESGISRYSLDMMKILDVTGRFNGIVVTITLLNEVVK